MREAILCGLVWLGCEVVFVGTYNRFRRLTTIKDKMFVGHSSALFLPGYMLTPLAFWLADGRHWVVRGLFYAICIFAVEFILNGLILWWFGTTPSYKSYSKAKWGVKGLIRLDYAGFWFSAALFVEWLVK